jgi:enediyne biosynthesis protein E4
MIGANPVTSGPINKSPIPGKQTDEIPDSLLLRYDDLSDRTGVDHPYRSSRESNAFSILEMMGGGVGAIDYDRDGLLDLALPSGGVIDPKAKRVAGGPMAFYRNLGGFRFQPIQNHTGTSESKYYSHSILCADYNDDGFDDFVVTGYGGLQLFRNQGDGTFVESAQSLGMINDSWNCGGAWGDFNRDGHLDLFVSCYADWSWEKDPLCQNGPEAREVCGPRSFDGVDDVAFLSDGQGGFKRADASFGLVPAGKGIGVLVADLNQDGWVDIYVANDTEANFYYENQRDGTVKECGMLASLALGENATGNASMGLALGDYNSDGIFDIWVTNFENESFALYRGKGHGKFKLAQNSSGLIDVGDAYVGWGTAFTDADLDGDEDIFVANGHVFRFPTNNSIEQPPVLWSNDGKGYFRNVTSKAGSFFTSKHVSRGVTVADIDGDLASDVLVLRLDGPIAVLKNTSQRRGTPFAIELVGTESNRNAIGTVVTVEAGGKKLVRQRFDGGYGGTHDRSIIFGIPADAKVDRMTIQWPNGKTQQWEGLLADRKLVIVEGKSALLERPRNEILP